MLSFLNPKIVIQPSVWWIIGIVITGSGVVFGGIVKIVIRNFTTWKAIRKEFQTIKASDDKDEAQNKRIDDLRNDMNSRFDGMDGR